MKSVGPLLVIAAVCCFAPALSSVIRDSNDEQDSVGEESCLKSVAKKKIASTQMLDLICAYMKYKDTPNKEGLIKAINDLQEASGCSTKDLFGTSASPEQVAMDEDGVLSNQIPAMKNLLKQCDVPLSVPILCIIRDNLGSEQASRGEAGQGNKRITRDLLGGLLGGNGGLLGGLLGGNGGLLGGLLGGNGGLLGGLLGGNGGNAGLLYSVLSLPRELLEALLGGNGGLLGGLLGGNGGRTGGRTGGGCQEQGGLGNIVGGLTDTLGGLTGGLLGGGGKGGLLGGVLDTVGGVTNVVGGLTAPLLGGGGKGNSGGGLLGSLLG